MITLATCTPEAYQRIHEALGPGVKLRAVGGSLGVTMSVETKHAAKARKVIAEMIENEGLHASLIPQSGDKKAKKKRRKK